MKSKSTSFDFVHFDWGVSDTLIYKWMKHFNLSGKCIAFMLAAFLLISNEALAQHVLHGTVLDDQNNPLPGATVIIKNTNDGTVADVDGQFMIEIPSPETVLQISFIGYTTLEVPAGTERERTFTLQTDADQLEEVVVVGYGTQEKVTVTGSVSNVSVDAIQRASTPSIANSIGGKLPGIITRQTSGEPGYDAAQVFIRGMGTWGNRAPLILVDGVERDMNQINAQVIESFTVLKDASATAVFGVRGANGVILITTKRGKQGRPQVTFRTENAILQSMRLPDYINGYEYASLINEGLGNVNKAPRYTNDELEKFRTGSDPYLYPNVNWVDEIFRETTSQSINNLSISGGNEFTRYFVNAGYTRQSGIYKEDNLQDYNSNPTIKRYNFRSNVDVDLSKSLTLSLGLAAIIQNGHYPGFGAGAIWDAVRRTTPIMFPVRNPDGTPSGVLAYLGSNPWGLVTQSGYERQDRSTLQGTFQAKWDLSNLVTEGLTANGLFSFDRYSAAHVLRRKIFGVKQYIGKNPDTGEDLYQVHREEESLGYSSNRMGNQALYVQASLNYERKFGNHNLSGMFLGNRREFVNLSAPTSMENIPFRRQGLATRITYGYDNRYLLEFNAGYNGSENFPEDKRYGFFPSISAGWLISNESFFDVSAISNLKIRGSHGSVGNDQVGGARFLYMSTMNENASGFRFGQNGTYYGGFSEDQTGYAGLTWETAVKSNIGLELGLWNDKLVWQSDVFYEDRHGILLQRQRIPSFAGYPGSSIPYGNLGKVKNKGVESQLEYRHTSQSGLHFSLLGNFTFAKNEIIYNDQPTPLYDYQLEAGNPVDQPFGYVSLGLFESYDEIENSPTQELTTEVHPGDIKYKDLNDDGVINTYDQKPIGLPRTPQIMYGFGGTVAYKGFDLSVFFSGAARTSFFLQGNVMWPFYDNLGSNNVMRVYYDNRWTEDNPDARYPRVTDGINHNNYIQSTHWERDGSYLRLKNAEIGYSLPSNVMELLKINSARVFVNGMNLALWDHVKVVDPESNSGTGFYPLQRTVNFGLEVKF